MDLWIALIGFAGAVIAAGLGFWQWKVGRRSAAPLTTKQVAATQEVWDKLEEVHVELRTGSTKSASEHLKAVNGLLLKQTPYLDPKFTVAAQEYLAALIKFSELIAASDDEQAQEDFAHTLANIASKDTMGEIFAAQQDVQRLREVVVVQVQRTLSS
jgi:hypothetical protein